MSENDSTLYSIAYHRHLKPPETLRESSIGDEALGYKKWATKKKQRSEERRGCKRYRFSGPFPIPIIRGSISSLLIPPSSFSILYIGFCLLAFVQRLSIPEYEHSLDSHEKTDITGVIFDTRDISTSNCI